MTSFDADDLIELAARAGLLNEQEARARLAGRPSTPAELVRAGLLSAEQVDRLFINYGLQAAETTRVPDAVRALEANAALLRTLADPIPSGEDLSDAPEEVRRAASDPARRLGRYWRLTLLGEGGFGQVWKGWDRSLRRVVALKLLKGTTPEDLSRFEREARLAAKLSHPGIAAIYDVGAADGVHYIAMQFVEGDVLSRIRLSPRESAAAIRDAARAVAYAHRAGVIHRDLKPANIIRTREGRTLILDFGLARTSQADSSVTLSGVVIGTPSYMSREQAVGEPADGRSDIYSLGASLYELIAGQPPFQGSTALVVLRQVIFDDPPPLKRVRPGIERDIETIVSKAMEKDPARRYESADELAEDLERYLNQEPIKARPASLLYRAAKLARRHRGVAAALVLSAMLLAAVLAYFMLWLPMRARAASRELLASLARSKSVLEREAADLFDRAGKATANGDAAGARASLKNLEDRFAPLHGRRLAVSIPTAHEDLLSDPPFDRLKDPYDLPLAQGSALLATLAADEERDAALARAYYYGATGSDPQERRAAADSWLQLADRFETQGAARRAAGAFRTFINRFPEDPRRFPAALREIESLISLQEYEEAEARLQDTPFPPSYDAQVREVRSFLARFVPMRPIPLEGVKWTVGRFLGTDTPQPALLDESWTVHLLALRDGGFDVAASTRLPAMALTPGDLAAGDLNGDGIDELIVMAGDSAGGRGSVGVYSADPTGTFSLTASDETLTSGGRAFTAELDADLPGREIVVEVAHEERTIRLYDQLLRIIHTWSSDPDPEKRSDAAVLAVANLDDDPADELLLGLTMWSSQNGYRLVTAELDAGQQELRVMSQGRERGVWRGALEVPCDSPHGPGRCFCIAVSAEHHDLAPLLNKGIAHLHSGIHRFHVAPEAIAWKGVELDSPGVTVSIPRWLGDRRPIPLKPFLASGRVSEASWLGPPDQSGLKLRMVNFPAPFSQVWQGDLDLDDVPELLFSMPAGHGSSLRIHVSGMAAPTSSPPVSLARLPALDRNAPRRSPRFEAAREVEIAGLDATADGLYENLLKDPNLAIEEQIEVRAAAARTNLRLSRSADERRRAADDPDTSAGFRDAARSCATAAAAHLEALAMLHSPRFVALAEDYADCMLMLGRASALETVLNDVLRSTHLTPAETQRLNGLLHRAHAAARHSASWRLSQSRLDELPLLVDHPLLVKFDRDRRSFQVWTHPAHRMIAGFLVRFDGEPFRLSVRNQIRLASWASSPGCGLVVWDPQPDLVPIDLSRWRLRANVGSHGSGVLPTRELHLDSVRQGTFVPAHPPYGHSWDWSFEWSNDPPQADIVLAPADDDRRHWARRLRTPSMEPGLYLLSLGQTSDTFRGPRNVDYWSSWEILDIALQSGSPAVGLRTPHDPFPLTQLLLANGDCVMGRYPQAIGRYDEILKAIPGLAALWESMPLHRPNGLTPADVKLRALLFRAFARMRNGDAGGAAADVAAALELDPVEVMTILQISAVGADTVERAFIRDAMAPLGRDGLQRLRRRTGHDGFALRDILEEGGPGGKQARTANILWIYLLHAYSEHWEGAARLEPDLEPFDLFPEDGKRFLDAFRFIAPRAPKARRPFIDRAIQRSSEIWCLDLLRRLPALVP